MNLPPLVDETDAYLNRFELEPGAVHSAARSFRLGEYRKLGATYAEALAAAIHFTMKHKPTRGYGRKPRSLNARGQS